MTRGTSMTFWPVRGWAGRGHTRSSTCSSTGKLRCFMHQCTATCCKQKHRSFLYLNACRTNTVKVTDRYQYPDNMPGDEDAFSREPFVVRFKAPKTCEGFFLCFFFLTFITIYLFFSPSFLIFSSACFQLYRSLFSSLNTPLRPTPLKSWMPCMTSCRT